MTPYPLSRSDAGTKILITLFLATMLAAFAVAELNVYDKVGRIKNGIARRYGPEQLPKQVDASMQPGETAPIETASVETSPPSDAIETGEAASIEADMPVARMNTFSALVDVTHPHVFELPLVVFVLAHFLMRTRAPRWLKVSSYIIGFGGIVLFLSAPWLVRYVSIKASPALYVGAAAIGASVFFMIVISLWDMWSPATGLRRSRKSAENGYGAH